jgi:DNA-binding CsgD family transcriptional regulator
MPAFDARLVEWVDLVADRLGRPCGGLALEELFVMLERTFEGRPSWNEVRADGTLTFEAAHLPLTWPGVEEHEWWHRNGPRVHPLIRWYAAGGDFTAMTMGRVPAGVTDSPEADLARERLRLLEIDQQLSIPCWVGPDGSRSFVMARSGEDFSEGDLVLARALQPLLILLARQAPLISATSQETLGLTGGELAVLRLLCEGRTAAAIAHRLGTSPRTVDKHLEHVYRKLGVRDRLAAYRVALESGLVRREVDDPRGD